MIDGGCSSFRSVQEEDFIVAQLTGLSPNCIYQFVCNGTKLQRVQVFIEVVVLDVGLIEAEKTLKMAQIMNVCTFVFCVTHLSLNIDQLIIINHQYRCEKKHNWAENSENPGYK